MRKLFSDLVLHLLFYVISSAQSLEGYVFPLYISVLFLSVAKYDTDDDGDVQIWMLRCRETVEEFCMTVAL